MMNGIRQICFLSVLCGVSMTVIPEGQVKRITSLACACVLILAALNMVRGMDYELYAHELSQQRENTEKFLNDTENLKDRLNRLVIEEECETYILDKAGQMGIRLASAAVRARWSMDGFWVPWELTLEGTVQPNERNALAEVIQAELGIPEARQYWSTDESVEG